MSTTTTTRKPETTTRKPETTTRKPETTTRTTATTTGTPVATTTRTVLRAEGFSCPSCVAKIERQVGRVKGVANVKVHFASARIEIDHDPERAPVEDLVTAVAKAGYRAAPAAF